MDLSVEQLQRQFDTGPVACLRTMQACYPHLKGRDGARVINFASSVGIKGTAGFAPYAMAKEAIRGLTRVAAREWGADGITVNNILPIARTDYYDATTQHDEGQASWVHVTPIVSPGQTATETGLAALVPARKDRPNDHDSEGEEMH